MAGERALVGRPRHRREGLALLGGGGQERQRREEEHRIETAERAHVGVADPQVAAPDRVDHLLRAEAARRVVLVRDLDAPAGALRDLAGEARVGLALDRGGRVLVRHAPGDDLGAGDLVVAGRGHQQKCHHHRREPRRRSSHPGALPPEDSAPLDGGGGTE